MNAGLFGLPKTARMRRGGLVGPLETRVANNSPVLDFVNWYDPKFDQYQIQLVDVLPSGTGANFNVAMRCSVDGGLSFDESNNYSWISVVAVPSAAGTAGANSTNYLGLCVMGHNSTNFGASGTFHLSNPDGLRYKQVQGTAVVHDGGQTATNVEVGWVAGAYMSTRPVNALRFLMSAGASGNLLAGVIRIYGIAK